MTMNQWLVDPSAILGLLNVAGAVTLASAIGLASARIRNSMALRHAILLASLVLVLLSPLIVGVSQTGGLGWLTVELNNTPSRSINLSGNTEVAATSGDERGESASLVMEGKGVTNQTKTGALPAKLHPRERAADRTGLAYASGTHNLPLSSSVDPSHSTDDASTQVPWWQLLGTLFAFVWTLGSGWAVAKLTKGFLIVLRLRRSLRVTSAELQRHARNAARHVGLRGAPEVFESDMAPTPLMMGLWRPIVVMPCGIEGKVETQQLEGMLIHEFAHIARRDQWIGLLQRAAAVLFWWQPLVRCLNSRLSSVREDVCDNYVIRRYDSGYAYAQVLVELAARVALRGPLPATIGLLEESDGLEGRVARLLDAGRSSETQLTRAASVVVGASGLLLATMLVVTSIRVVHASQDEASSEPAANANEIYVRNNDELLRAARVARPGTTILLKPGTYRGGVTLNNLHGTAKRPITIAAADPNNRPIIKGGNSCLHLTDPAHVELRNLVLTGARVNGLNIDDGSTYDTPAHHVVLHGLTVRDIGSDRNHDGIKLSGLDDFRVENCTVERWGKKGSGIDMVGCHRGIVTGSTFRGGDKVFGNGVQMKGGSLDITVSFCRFENAGGRSINIGGSTGLAYFRPKPEGYEAKDIVVEDCTFIGSMAPVAFVGVDGAVVRHNTFYRPTRWVLRILQENQAPEFVPCQDGKFTNNIVVFRSDELAYAVNIGPKTDPKSFRFSDNFWYCEDRPEKTRKAIHLPAQETDGVYGIDPRLRAPKQGDLRLADGTPVNMAGVRPDDPR